MINMKNFAKIFTVALIAILWVPLFVHAQAGPGATLTNTGVAFGTFDGGYGAQISGAVTLPAGMTTEDIAVFVAVLDEPITDLAGYNGSYYAEFIGAGDFYGVDFGRFITTTDGVTPFTPDEDYFFIYKLASLGNPATFAPVYAGATATATGAPPIPVNNDPGTMTTTDTLVYTDFSRIINPLGEDWNAWQFLHKLFSNFVKIALPFLVLFMVYSGFLFVEAQGNEEKLSKAKKNFLYVIIGGLLILSAWTIALVLKGTVDQFEQAFLNHFINLV